MSNSQFQSSHTIEPGAIRLTKVTDRTYCDCGYVLALHNDDVTLFKASAVLIDSEHRMVLRCGRCKRVTTIADGKKLLTY